MRAARLHAWDITLAEAAAVQRDMAVRVSQVNGLTRAPRYIAGVDISGAWRGEEATGAVVVLTYPGLLVAEVRTVRIAPPFPYVPGFLSFREIPVLLPAFERLSITPDLLLVDGHGLAHPRRFGIACHLGVLLDVPAIGCGKSLLVGEHDPVPLRRGSWRPVAHRGEVVGAALRTKDGVKPVYVSVGHKIDLKSAVRWTLACATRYRLPDPTRLAHEAASGRLAPED